MSINFDEVGTTLHAKLDRGIEQLKSSQAHLQDVEKQTEDAIDANLKKANDLLKQTEQDAQAAKDKLVNLVEAKKSETMEAITEWKTNRDINKLEKRAERAQEDAQALVELALYYAAQADVAILEAVSAQLDANNAR